MPAGPAFLDAPTKPAEGPWRNLVFEGGGVRGAAYAGALQVLEERGMLAGVRRVGGSSAGAMQALMLALGYSGRELAETLVATDFQSFLDRPRWPGGNLLRLARQRGLHSGDALVEWARRRMAGKGADPDATFAELHAWAVARGLPDPYLLATELETREGRVFSREHAPDVPVALAMRLSLSIPLLFAALRWQGRTYLDGGVVDNYPIQMFDHPRYLAVDGAADGASPSKASAPSPAARPGPGVVVNEQTLGFNLHALDQVQAVLQPAARPVTTWRGFAHALAASAWDAQERRMLHFEDARRTLYVDPLGIPHTDFGLSRQQKLALVESGRRGAAAYIAGVRLKGSIVAMP